MAQSKVFTSQVYAAKVALNQRASLTPEAIAHYEAIIAQDFSPERKRNGRVNVRRERALYRNAKRVYESDRD